MSRHDNIAFPSLFKACMCPVVFVIIYLSWFDWKETANGA